MSQNVPEMDRSDDDETRLKATELLAAGVLTQEDIADQLGIDRRTLYRWRQDPDFAARVEVRVQEIGAEVRRIGIADQSRRLAALNDRWNRMRRVLESRADDPTMQGIPGGSTGLLVRTTKGIGKGADFQVIEEYAVDTGLLAELRATEKQAAQELGQWTEKKEVSGPGGKPISLEVLSADELDALETLTVRLVEARPGDGPPVHPGGEMPSLPG